MLIVVADSCNFLNSLSTLQISVDKSIGADGNCIRYEYKMASANKIIWVPGKVNLAGSKIKIDSLLTCAMIQTMASD